MSLGGQILEMIDNINRLLGDDLKDTIKPGARLKKERREFFIPKSQRESGLYGTELEIQLRNKLTQRAVARECADWVRQKARFRSNKTKAPMQSFVHVAEGNNRVAYMPVNGFTAVDLGYQQGNAVSNFVTRMDEPTHVQMYLQLFDQIWNDPDKVEDVTTAICDHIKSVYQENAPERIYFIMLYNIFHDFLEDVDEDVLPNDLTGYRDSLVWNKLFNYQKDATTGIINKLETYNGCILADSVGLGKTFTALAVVKYYELRNKSVLVLCPKKLADNWRNYNSNLTTNIFAKDRETRYQRLMNKVIRAGVKTKVLMLSATPVNNRFSDLRNQLALAYEGQSETLGKHLKTETSVEEIFRRAQKAFNEWSALPPEERTASSILRALDFDFFELLDSVTIARSRKHIQTFYDTTDIGPFPERRKPLSFHCPITERTDVADLNHIFTQLSVLKLAVYAPISYILPSRIRKYEDLYDTQVEGGKGKLRQADREHSLQALMTTNLLKRLESSVAAFRLTLASLGGNLTRTLEAIEAFESSGQAGQVGDYLDDIDAFDGDDEDLGGLDEFTVGKKVQISLADMDLPSWRHDLAADLPLIDGLLEAMRKVTPADDAKLQHLLQLINGKLETPLNPGNRKVLIFTAFADTANYLYDNLAPMARKLGLHVGKVTGSSAPKSTLHKAYDFQSLLTLFSPRSKEKAIALPDEPGELDILIGTDCISEGQNLQDCDYLVNYDIHWNPVRIIQRFGRIDRIGSPNQQIQLVNYWPDISLDEYINLKERVENRMVIADVTATGDDNVLTAKSSEIAYRKEQLKRMQDEVIELENVPFGMHAIVPAQPQLGIEPGVIFALKNIHDSVNVNQQNRLHPYYLVYIADDGEMVADHTEVKRLLDLVRSSCKGKVEPIHDLCQLFNEQTGDGRNMKRYSDLLSQAIRSMIDVKDEKDIDSLFGGGRTTALTNTIKGLDDFELIAFLVIERQGA